MSTVLNTTKGTSTFFISCDPRALAGTVEETVKVKKAKAFEVFLAETHTCFCSPVERGIKRVFKLDGFKIREAMILAAHCENCHNQRSWNKDASDIFNTDITILMNDAMSWYKAFVITEGDLQKYTADMTGGKLASFSLGCDKNSAAVMLTVTEEELDFPERWNVEKSKGFEDDYNDILDTALKFCSKLCPHSPLNLTNEEVIRTYMLHVLF